MLVQSVSVKNKRLLRSMRLNQRRLKKGKLSTKKIRLIKMKKLLKPLNIIQKYSKSLITLSVSVLIMSLSACTTHTLIPQSLLVPCKNPKSLDNGNAETVGYLLIENAKEQIDCKMKHDAIIEIVTPQ